MARRFVKSGDTRTPVGNSRNELERMLARYGCTAFGSHTEYGAGGKIVIGFVVPDHLNGPDAARIPVRLEISVEAVATAIYGPLKGDRAWTEHGIAQAERVAWRHMVLWVDAALSAAAAGVQKISEAFLAHTLVRGTDGKSKRMVDHLDDAAPGGNWRALLPPSTGEGSR